MNELNDEINELKDHLHIILYVLKSNDERMFADMEYAMINAVSKQEKSKLLYILTHSTNKTNKDEIIDRINVGLRNILEKNIKDDYYSTYLKMRAYKDNCIFVNFHKDENSPVLGISDLFNKICSIAKETDIYKKYIKKDMTKMEFQKLIDEEADIRKKKAEKILLYHSIGAGAIGLIPGVDLAVQKFVIQKKASKKIGQIFGLDINLIAKEKDSFNKEKANNDKNFAIENDKEKDPSEKYYKGGQYAAEGVRLGTGIGAGVGDSINIASQVAQLSGQIGLAALRGISITFIFIGSAVGIGTGYYFTRKHCIELIEKLYKYFKENIETLSNSLIQAVEYLELMAKQNKKN